MVALDFPVFLSVHIIYNIIQWSFIVDKTYASNERGGMFWPWTDLAYKSSDDMDRLNR